MDLLENLIAVAEAQRSQKLASQLFSWFPAAYGQPEAMKLLCLPRSSHYFPHCFLHELRADD